VIGEDGVCVFKSAEGSVFEFEPAIEVDIVIYRFMVIYRMIYRIYMMIRVIIWYLYYTVVGVKKEGKCKVWSDCLESKVTQFKVSSGGVD
jgi:hypothetical protein